MAYIRNIAAAGPATHALVIGVGKYAPNDWQLDDLQSPISSAEQFGRWILDEYRNAVAPLASVEVVWSPGTGPQNFSDGTGTQYAVEAATMTNVNAAVKRWYKLCDTSVDNVGVLYFCGHGFQKGASKYLLLEGFAAPGNLSVGDDAVDFDAFALGMERCAARKQVYFLDACRTTPEPALKIPIQMGRPIVDPDYSKITTNLTRDWPVLCSASEGQAAFGASAGVSRFTSALLMALRGAGWDDRTMPWKEWSVQVDNLTTFIKQLLKYEEEVRGAPPQDAKLSGDSAGFVFHEPAPGAVPLVPLYIDCRQNGATLLAHIAINQGGTILHQTNAVANSLEHMAPVGFDLTVNATANGNTRQQSIVLRPACKIAHLEL